MAGKVHLSRTRQKKWAKMGRCGRAAGRSPLRADSTTYLTPVPRLLMDDTLKAKMQAPVACYVRLSLHQRCAVFGYSLAPPPLQTYGTGCT